MHFARWSRKPSLSWQGLSFRMLTFTGKGGAGRSHTPAARRTAIVKLPQSGCYLTPTRGHVHYPGGGHSVSSPVLTFRVGTVELRIPNLRKGRNFPGFREPRRLAEKALTAVIQEAYIQAMGMLGISKSQVSRLCADIEERVTALPRLPDQRRLALSLAGRHRREDAPERAHHPGGRQRRVQHARYMTLETIAPLGDEPIVSLARRGSLTPPVRRVGDYGDVPTPNTTPGGRDRDLRWLFECWKRPALNRKGAAQILRVGMGARWYRLFARLKKR